MTVNMHCCCHKNLAKFNLHNYGESSPTGKHFYIGNPCWIFVFFCFCFVDFFFLLAHISTEQNMLFIKMHDILSQRDQTDWKKEV